MPGGGGVRGWPNVWKVVESVQISCTLATLEDNIGAGRAWHQRITTTLKDGARCRTTTPLGISNAGQQQRWITTSILDDSNARGEQYRRTMTVQDDSGSDARRLRWCWNVATLNNSNVDAFGRCRCPPSLLPGVFSVKNCRYRPALLTSNSIAIVQCCHIPAPS